MIDDTIILKNPFSETLDLLNVSEEYSLEMEEIGYSVEETVLSRLNSWIHYFNQNYTKFICGYSHTVSALIEAAKNNQMYSLFLIHQNQLSIYST